MVCHVKEETQQNMWYLDTSCSNHICGDKMMFSDLDETFCNTVKFGDNSTVSVLGKGMVTLQTKPRHVSCLAILQTLSQNPDSP